MDFNTRVDPTQVVYVLIHLLLVIGGYAIFATTNGLWWQGIGTSVAAAGLSGIVVFTYVLLSQETAKRIRTISELGIQSGFAGRGARIRAEYDARLLSLRHHLDVMGFGLKALRDDYRDEVPKWAHSASVRILVIDPDFPVQNPYANQRDLEEDNTEGSIRNDVHLFIREFRSLIRAGRLKVRLYRCLPAVNVFRIDDELFWGPYLIKQQSRNSPTLLVRRGGVLFDLLLRHFETIWSSSELSRDVPSEWVND